MSFSRSDRSNLGCDILGLMLPQCHTRKLQKNIATMLKLLQHIPGKFQEFATTLLQNLVRKHLHNIMARFIDNAEVL